MPKLSSEDEEIKSSFEIAFLNKIKSEDNSDWIKYKLNLVSADKKLDFSNEENKGTGDYVFSITPINEIESLVKGINNFLKDKETKMFSFEPFEPSFELLLERSHNGYSFTTWVDAGNVISDHFTWDSFGLRFFTSEEKIKSFVDELERIK